MRREYRDLVICNSCQWSASILMDSYIFSKCPKCMADDIEVIPVEDYEKYSLSINKDRGIDVEFSDDRTRSGYKSR
jgi:peptide subunit release factor 1 (eRF1)